MKLTEEQAKKIVSKVFVDLKMDFHEKYPVKVHFHEKSDNNVFFKQAYWSGDYDYSKTIKGFELEKTYPYDPVIIDDEKGIAIAVVFFPEPNPIKLNESGKYVWGES